MSQQPSIGRIVHYQHGTGPHATVPAIITSVEHGVTLSIFLPGVSPRPVLDERGEPATVPFADEPTEAHWNWPPKVG